MGVAHHDTQLATEVKGHDPRATGSAELLCPFDLSVQPVARFLNTEIADHPVYDGLELQWFDDERVGTGMLAFLSRRADRLVDYYVDPGLNLDRSTYQIGGGTGRWVETRFDVARLDVGDRGVVADVGFTDADGSRVEIAVDDRGRRRRRPADLLAPVSSAIDQPTSLLLVYLHGFDLVRRQGAVPRITIGGQRVSTGSLPGAVLHRRHLIKAAAPLSVATVCPARSGVLEPVDVRAPGRVVLTPGLDAVAAVGTSCGDARAALRLDPPLRALGDLADGEVWSGSWDVTIDRDVMTGGTWRVRRAGEAVRITLAVTRPWVPRPGLPLLMRIVTRALPVFRRWPTTYAWAAEVDLATTPATISSSWHRTGSAGGAAYRRATGS